MREIDKINGICEEFLDKRTNKKWQEVKAELEKVITKRRKVKRVFKTYRQGVEFARKSLMGKPYQGQRTFWVNGIQYVARKTNSRPDYVNLSIKAV